MRLRLNPVTAYQIEQVAKRENRSCANAAALLIAEAIRHRNGQAAATTPAGPIDDACERGRTLACHVGDPLIAAVRAFAEHEERSLSSAMKILLRSALRAKGLLPDPAEHDKQAVHAA